MSTNDPKHAKENLTCKGKVLAPFTSTPRMVSFRGLDSASSPMPQTLTLTHLDGGPLKLELMDTGNPGITAELREIKPGESYQLIVGLAPPQKPGQLVAAIRLKTGVSELPETTIGVYADIPASWAGL